jgi:hypothetical protein
MFIFTPLRLLVWLLGLLILALPTLAIVFFLLAVVGGPGGCDERDPAAPTDVAAAAAFQTKWDQLNATLAAGQNSTITVTQEETTARARQWVDEHDAPVDQLLICFEVDSGAASGKVDIPFFPGDVDVLVRGTIDMTGEHPEATIDSIEVGSLPGPLTDRAGSFINRLIADQTEQVTLSHDYGIFFGDGTATISGQPELGP